jgi:hypothetical protein
MPEENDTIALNGSSEKKDILALMFADIIFCFTGINKNKFKINNIF